MPCPKLSGQTCSSNTNQVKNKLEELTEKLGYLLEERLIEEIARIGKVIDVDANEVILYPGDPIEMIPIVLSGALKISRENEVGEELLLYYLEGGETCAMTVQCCVRKKQSEIRATVVENASLLMIPIAKMDEWMVSYKSWREFILQSYHFRMMELIDTVDALAFKRLDERLETYLKDQAKLTGSLEINRTHQQIADDLHSSRVVISRLLKQLEGVGTVQIKRTKIVLKSI